MKAFGHLSGGFDANTVWENGMECPDQLATIMGPIRVKVKALAAGMHPGIRSAASVGQNFRIKDL